MLLWLCNRKVRSLQLGKRTVDTLRSPFYLLNKLKKRGHLTVTIKITWTRVALLGAIFWCLWPHSSTSIAVSEPQPIVIQVPKPLKVLPDTKLQPQNTVDSIYIAPVYTPVVTAQSDQSYMDYIFAHEGSLSSVNSLGCKGEGQDCNGGLVIACPDWQTDKPCQDAFFTNYMLGRYGTWEAAYNFKVLNGWW